MSGAYYNENDAFAAQWLRNLVAAGHIAPGDVDDRSILDVDPDDLRGYTQHHFFAGLGGWSYALRLAGVPDDRAIWTGSCPCQPLSSAGRRKGADDERHLWPAFYRLIAERRPATIFGENVTGALGREWLAGVRADLEDAGYAVGCADLPAACVGAPHIRQRLFWVAHTCSVDLTPGRLEGGPALVATEQGGAEHRSTGGVADACGQRSEGRVGNGGGVADRTVAGRRALPQRDDRTNGRAAPEPRRLRDPRGLGHADGDGRGTPRDARSVPEGRDGPRSTRPRFWDGAEWLQCLDGRARRAQPGIFPLASGVSNRVGQLRAAGNAITAPAAAEFIAAAMECLP